MPHANPNQHHVFHVIRREIHQYGYHDSTGEKIKNKIRLAPSPVPIYRVQSGRDPKSMLVESQESYIALWSCLVLSCREDKLLNTLLPLSLSLFPSLSPYSLVHTHTLTKETTAARCCYCCCCYCCDSTLESALQPLETGRQIDTPTCAEHHGEYLHSQHYCVSAGSHETVALFSG